MYESSERKLFKKGLTILFTPQVDAHNVVPCKKASDKQEYSAKTIRKKIHDKLPEFLTKFPPVIKHPYKSKDENEVCFGMVVKGDCIKIVFWEFSIHDLLERKAM